MTTYDSTNNTMAAIVSTEAPSLSSSSASRGTGRPRRPRRGGRNGHLPTRSSNQPTSVEGHIQTPPTSQTTSVSSQAQSQTSTNDSSAGASNGPTRQNRGRGERGGNTGRRGRGSRNNIGVHRAFGGLLSTTDGNSANTSTTALNAGAQEFKPGQPILPRFASLELEVFLG